MAKDWGIFGDTMRAVGKHREDIGAKAVKQKVVKKAVKPVVKNNNKPAPVIKTSAEKAAAQKAAIRKRIAAKIAAEKKRKAAEKLKKGGRQKVAGGYIE